jgi:hypothetical protein
VVVAQQTVSEYPAKTLVAGIAGAVNVSKFT